MQWVYKVCNISMSSVLLLISIKQLKNLNPTMPTYQSFIGGRWRCSVDTEHSYLISTVDSLQRDSFHRVLWRHSTALLFICYWSGKVSHIDQLVHLVLISIPSKPLNTVFSCSWPELSEPQGLICLSSSNSVFFPLFQTLSCPTLAQFQTWTYLCRGHDGSVHPIRYLSRCEFHFVWIVVLPTFSLVGRTPFEMVIFG